MRLCMMFLAALAMTHANAAIAQTGDKSGDVSTEETTLITGWEVSPDHISVRHSGIKLPKNAGELALVKVEEFSQKGDGVDNIAQYGDSSGKIFGTVYIYRPALADADLTFFQTDIAIRRSSQTINREVHETTGFGGIQNGAIYALYNNAYEAKLTSAAAFARVGNWIVKVRISGPAEKRAEIIAAMQQLLANTVVDEPSDIQRTVASYPGRCGSKGRKDAQLIKSTKEDSLENALSSSMVTNNINMRESCIHNYLIPDDRAFPVFLSTGESATKMWIPLNDAGAVAAVSKRKNAEYYTVSIYSIAKVDIFGSFKSLPSNSQLRSLLSGKASSEEFVKNAQTIFKADGNSNVTIYTK